MRRGVHHLGLATYDYERCVDFFTRVVGFEIGWQDLQQASDGTVLMRHVFFDTGDGTYLAIMAPTTDGGAPEEWAADINSALGLSPYTYHFAFWLDSLEELDAMRERLAGHGVKVTDPWDHEWCTSIYFRDPDGHGLEFCVTTRVFNKDDDPLLKPRVQPVFETLKNDPEMAKRASEAMGIPVDAWNDRPQGEPETVPV
jgi:catechol 2,3-dioxygenase-like lactoylglutathione lyase family enzyme